MRIRKGKIKRDRQGPPSDLGGKRVLVDVFSCARELDDEIKVAYPANYSMDLAARMGSGFDV